MDDQDPRRALPASRDGGGAARADRRDDAGTERDPPELEAPAASDADGSPWEPEVEDRAAAALMGRVLTWTDCGPMRVVDAKFVTAMPPKSAENKVPFSYVAAWGDPVKGKK